MDIDLHSLSSTIANVIYYYSLKIEKGVFPAIPPTVVKVIYQHGLKIYNRDSHPSDEINRSIRVLFRDACRVMLAAALFFAASKRSAAACCVLAPLSWPATILAGGAWSIQRALMTFCSHTSLPRRFGGIVLLYAGWKAWDLYSRFAPLLRYSILESNLHGYTIDKLGRLFASRCGYPFNRLSDSTGSL